MRDLASELTKLNDDQRVAVCCPSNTLVWAGPGSGKTRTVVAKVAFLLAEEVKPPRGLACVTFSNDSVREFQSGLADFGIYPSHRLFLGTVHSFCLNSILKVFARLLIPEFPDGIRVAGPKLAQDTLDEVCARYFQSVKPRVDALTWLRRAIACRETDIPDHVLKWQNVYDAYHEALLLRGLVDFDEIISLSLRLVEENAYIRESISARFPWLIVDEYQDLGGPIHRIVLQLIDKAGIKVMAVGDPDQTIFGFTGGSPKYIEELNRRLDFHTIRLPFNYRSGKKLIAASAAVLEEQQKYEPSPDSTGDGEIYACKLLNGGLQEQAQVIFETIIPRLRKDHIPLHQIAILYRDKRNVLRDLLTVFQSPERDENIPFRHERDERYPKGPIVRWLQDCAIWSLQEIGTKASILYEDLWRYYRSILVTSGRSEDDDSRNLATRCQLFTTLEQLGDPSLPIAEWLCHLDEQLSLTDMLAQSPELAEAAENFKQLARAASPNNPLADYSLDDFRREGETKDKVIITTIHGSKGREFEVVIMPGLQETILPHWRTDPVTSALEEPDVPDIEAERRLFYVGVTRAKQYVFFVYSAEPEGSVSRFVNTVVKREKLEEHEFY